MTNSVLLNGHQLSYRVDEVTLLEQVSMEVYVGELVGLIGPNGAGKSTLLRLLTDVTAADTGKVFYKQQLLQTIPVSERARLIGYLVQGAKAHWPFSVEKVVELGRLPYQKWWQHSSAEDKRRVEQALQLTETLAYRNRMVTTLSGGEQTLVMLARIFATEPEIIFADEPVAALDPYHQLHVMELLRDHVEGSTAQKNKAGVVVLHDLSLAARFCDRLYLLNHGKLFCEGTPQEVLSDTNLAEVYGVKARIDCSEGGVAVTPVSRLNQGHP